MDINSTCYINPYTFQATSKRITNVENRREIAELMWDETKVRPVSLKELMGGKGSTAAQEAYERQIAANRTYEFADERMKKKIAHLSNYYLSTVPESVKQAWQAALEETGVNPFASGGNTLSQLAVEQDFLTGGNDQIFGGSIESSIDAVKNILNRIENPLGEVTEERAEMLKQEKAFYKSFIERLEQISGSVNEINSSYIKTSYKTSSMEAYFTSYTYSVRDEKQTYETYQSENYKIVPDNEAGCFDIYNKQGERLGAFSYSDIVIRQDPVTGKQFLISEHGTMSYDALVLDDELKDALANVMGKDGLETEELVGYTLQTHPETGIQYLLREGEEGRGGKVLLQSEEDIAKYEALAEAYFNKYPNLIKDKNAAYIWADLEIKGLAKRAEHGIISMGFNGMSYNDNSDYQNNWSAFFSESTYKAIFEYIQNNRISMDEMQKFSIWQDIFDNIGSRYEMIWF